jgi:hypothetical protein
MEPNITLAPGCYGMSMCYREGTAECGTCPFASSCGPLAAQQLAMLRAELGVVMPKRKPVDKPQKAAAIVPAAVMELTNGLPKKVAAWIAYIEREGIKVTDALTKGENPFRGKRPPFMAITCHLLLKLPQGVSRDLLARCLQEKLSWSAETTAAHVTQVRQILTALGAIDEVDGMIKLRAA